MGERLLTTKSLTPYQQASYRLNVSEVIPGDPFEGNQPFVLYTIRDSQGMVLFSSKAMITPELAIDIIHAVDASHEDGRQLGRIEKTAEIRKVLEIHS